MRCSYRIAPEFQPKVSEGDWVGVAGWAGEWVGVGGAKQVVMHLLRCLRHGYGLLPAEAVRRSSIQNRD